MSFFRTFVRFRPLVSSSFSSSAPSSLPSPTPFVIFAPRKQVPKVIVRMCHYRNSLMGEGSGSQNQHARELLPANVIPKHYELSFEPNFSNFTFEGTTKIDLDVVEDSKSIAVHTLELDLHNVIVSSGGQTISSSPQISYDAEKQVSTFTFDNSITKGSTAQLEIKFTGQLNDKMAGFYRSTYKDEAGNEKIMATTQMAATDTRRAFPCFDEPALKATFDISLIAEKHLTCLSNMDVASENDAAAAEGKKLVKFNRTPKMSTYLVAFIIGELNYVESNDFRVPVRVYAPRGCNIEHGRMAADLAAKTLHFYEKIFGIDFPLPKMDQVAIPDFAAGAMENWGLIAYREVLILFNPETSGATAKERVCEVVQHELAHQWFGNLVTMDWWDGLWLNEGFATWVSWYSSHEFFPDWHVWQTFVTDTLQSALQLDSLRSSHPIEVPVNRAGEINQIFDDISYAKGSCVLRMLSTHIGEDVFLKGVQNYLKKHEYGSTKTEDLWDALSAASGEPLHEVMATWTKKIGYPLLTVTEKDDGKTITVKQNRFLRTGDVKEADDEILYPTFLNLRTQDGVDKSQTLKEREQTFELSSTDFYKLNADHTCLYRTLYPPHRLNKLAENVRQGLLPPEDRTGLVADTGALAAAGYQRTSGFLTLLKGFEAEAEFVVWKEILSRLGSVRAAWMFEDEGVKDALKAFQRELIGKKVHELGWSFSEEDGHVAQQFKTLLFGAAGSAGDEKVVGSAMEMFDKYAAGDKSAIPSNIRRSVFTIALENGGDKEYDQLLAILRSSNDADERNTILRIVGSTRAPALITKTLSLLFSPDVKDQDVVMVAGSLRSSPASVNALFEWMTEHWDEMYEKLPPSLPMLGTMVMLMTSGFTREEQLRKVEGFFEGKNQNGYDQTLAQSKDTIRSKIGWVERDREDVKEWLKTNGYLS